MISHLQARRFWVLLGLAAVCCTGLTANDEPVRQDSPAISAGPSDAGVPPALQSLSTPTSEASLSSTGPAGYLPHHDSGGHASSQTDPDHTVVFSRRAHGKRPLRGSSRLPGLFARHFVHSSPDRFHSDLGLSGPLAGASPASLYCLSAAYLL